MASKFTSGIDHRHPDLLSICLFLDPVFDRYNIVDFVKCVAW